MANNKLIEETIKYLREAAAAISPSGNSPSSSHIPDNNAVPDTCISTPVSTANTSRFNHFNQNSASSSQSTPNSELASTFPGFFSRRDSFRGSYAGINGIRPGMSNLRQNIGKKPTRNSPYVRFHAANSWTQKFFCLGKCNDNTTADRSYSRDLDRQNLGFRKIKFEDKNGSHDEFIRKLCDEFPLLKSQQGAIMLWKCTQGGNQKRPLEQIFPGNEGYSIPFLRSRIQGGSTLYITPLQSDIFQEEVPTNSGESLHESESTDPINAFCSRCKQNVLLAEFPKHVHGCAKKMLDEEKTNVEDSEILNEENAPEKTNEGQLLSIFDGELSRSQILKIASLNSVMNDAVDSCLKFCNEKEDFSNDIKKEVTSLQELQKLLLEKCNAKGTYLLNVDRDEIWRAVLLHYKRALANRDSKLNKELVIQFTSATGENESVDAGAIKTEFFETTFSIMKERLFEGDIENGLIPKRIGNVSISNFKVVGAVIADAFIQSGLTFSSFPEWLYVFFVDESDEDLIKCMMSIDHIPKDASTVSLIEFLTSLSDVSKQNEMEQLLDRPEYMERINTSQWNITTQVNLENRGALIDELLYDELLRRRLQQLTAIREGLKDSGLLYWINSHSAITKDIFIVGYEDRSNIANFFSTAITDASVNQTDKTHLSILDWFKEYVSKADDATLRRLVSFTTSVKTITKFSLAKPLKISFLQDDENEVFPKCSVCFRILSLPVVHTKPEKLFLYINKAIECESEGFTAPE